MSPSLPQTGEAAAAACHFQSAPLSRYKHYERWATANDFPVESVVNDGSTTLEDRLGAVADLELVIRSRKLQDDVMVVGGSWFLHVEVGRVPSVPTSCAGRLRATCCAPTRTSTLPR